MFDYMANKLISYYFNVLKTSLNRFTFNLKNFGVKVSIFNFLGELAYFKLFRGNKISNFLRRKQKTVVYNALEERYADLINDYKSRKIDVGENSKKIWFMRWTGIDDDNIVVKKCFESVNKYSGDYEVILITKDNYDDYVDIPKEIIKKVNEGTISLTHLSDVMRSQLLSKYGGVWADSTMLFFDNIFDEFNDNIFNSPSIGDSKWCSFFMGGKANKLFSFIRDLFAQYHSEYDELIDYLLVDQGITLAYNNFNECKTYVDDSTLVNEDIFYFLEHFSDTYVKEEFEEVCKRSKYFKISDKASVNAKLYDENGNLTNYGYFINELEFK